MQILIPQGSTVYLYKTHTADERELAFSSVEAQSQYYNRHMLKQFNNVSVVKRNSILKLQISMGDAAKCNMLSFINPDFDNKMFYAKILDYEYGNNNMTLITYEIDYWQTFMFDIEYYDSMIEREHLSEALYQQALANPQDDSIIELAVEEDITVPEEAYTYTNDGNSSWGAPSKVLPSKNLESVFLLQVAPFMDTEEKDAEGFTRADRVKALEDEWKKFAKEKGLSENFGYYTGNIDPKTGLPEKTFGGHFADFMSGITFGDTDEAMDDIDAAWTKRKNEVLARFKPSSSQTKSEWNEFLSLFPEVIPPQITKGGVQATYLLVQPFNGGGQSKIQEAIDYLTLKGASSSIVGFYIVPRYLVTGDGGSITIQNPSNSRHPKLNSGKFSYIDVFAPDGTNKKYEYRKFLDNKNQRFVVMSNINGQPTLSLAPVNYLQDNSSDGLTIGNSLNFSNFASPAYLIDSYLTYLSSQMQAGVMEKSTINQQRHFRNNALNLAQSTMGGAQTGAVAGPLGAAGGALSGLGNGIFNNTMNNLDRNTIMKDAELMNSANPTGATAYKKGLTPSLAWKGSEDAFHNDTFVSGSSNGWLPYMYGGIRFRLDFKYINAAYRERYEKYFDHYGYKSNRFGGPRVGLWVRGDGSQEPHWETVNGLPSTYIKTDGCRVLGPFLNATRSIQSMFDSGVRFIKGDGL